MKIKKFTILLLLLISCMFAFSACSNLNFDENSTVKLTYTCADEEKNFDTELTAEQSNKFIKALNKITFSVVIDKDIQLDPSYDCLTIKINNDALFLYDVGQKIKYGGYFYLNGKLYKSKEKFDFLDSYMNEYTPDIAPDSVSFGVQYVKSTVGAEETCQIIKSVNQLNNYIATEKQNIDLPNLVLFRDEVVNMYNNEYFENSFLVIFMKAARSGSFDFRVNNVQTNNDTLIINYEIVLPTGYGEDVAVTCDMAYWYSFIELSNEYSAIKNVDLIAKR